MKRDINDDVISKRKEKKREKTENKKWEITNKSGNVTKIKKKGRKK